MQGLLLHILEFFVDFSNYIISNLLCRCNPEENAISLTMSEEVQIHITGDNNDKENDNTMNVNSQILVEEEPLQICNLNEVFSLQEEGTIYIEAAQPVYDEISIPVLRRMYLNLKYKKYRETKGILQFTLIDVYKCLYYNYSSHFIV